MFSQKNTSVSNDPVVYQTVLTLILSIADQFDPRLDRYSWQQDKDGNGWDIYYFGFSNQDGIKKNAYAKQITKNYHTGERLDFNRADTEAIIKKMNEEASYKLLV